jgi:phosphohistidine phosphatase
MRTLMLLRHAKSDWNAPTEGDFARPLNKRGRRDAETVARVIAALPHPPQAVVSSPAARAMRTAESVAEALDGVEVQPEDDLYGAGPEQILSVVRRLPKEADCALVVGHNPGLEELVHELGGEPDLLMKTCTLAVFECDGGWGKLAPGACRLVRVIVAREAGESA